MQIQNNTNVNFRGTPVEALKGLGNALECCQEVVRYSKEGYFLDNIAIANYHEADRVIGETVSDKGFRGLILYPESFLGSEIKTYKAFPGTTTFQEIANPKPNIGNSLEIAAIGFRIFARKLAGKITGENTEIAGYAGSTAELLKKTTPQLPSGLYFQPAEIALFQRELPQIRTGTIVDYLF